MAQNIILKRSAVAGRVPDTGSINLGELAVNTFDGKIYFKKSGSNESVETIVTTDSITSGSIFVSEDITTQRDLYVIRDVITDGDIDAAGSLSGSGLSINDTLSITHNNFQLSGSSAITGSLTVLGSINARQFNIDIISSSTLYESGSSNFGNSLDDTHTFTGSVNITGSIFVNGNEIGAAGGNSYTGSFTGSFIGDGSGLRGVVSDDIPRDGWDYNSNDSASISEFNVTSSKYLIDFQWEQEVGTAVGLKAFLANTTGSSQIVPTSEGIKFIVGNQLVATVDENGINATLPSGVVSSSAQLTASYDSRYVLSGSITQTTWDNIASKPNGIISSSLQLSELNTFTQSANSRLNSLENESGSYAISSSVATATANSITTLSSSVKAVTDILATTESVNTLSASIATRDINQDTTTTNISTSVASRLNTIETTYATTGSNTFKDTQIISSSMYITGNLIVQGTSSIQNITASAVSIGTNVVYLNTNSPAINYAGISVIDSGSSGATGSLFWDSTNSRWLYQKESGSSYSGGMLISGPRNLGALGDEVGTLNNVITKGQGGDHITSSQITDDGTTVSIPGTLSASVLTGIGNVTTYSSSVNSRVTTIEGKYATTGSNTFVGNQIVSGSLYQIVNNNTWAAKIINSNTSTDNAGLLVQAGVNAGNEIALFKKANGTSVLTIDASGVILPGANGTQDLGSSSYRWANIYTNDLHLSNENKKGGNDVDGTTGNWTIQEGHEHLYIINNKTGKKFKFSLEEIQ